MSVPYVSFLFTAAVVEPPHGAAVEEHEHPALLEIKPSSAGPTVWSEFSGLAAETGAINLGQVHVVASHFQRITCSAVMENLERLVAANEKKRSSWRCSACP